MINSKHFNLLKLFFLLFFFSLDVLIEGYQEIYRGNIRADDISYTSVIIPESTDLVEIKIKTVTSLYNPQLIFRYNGLPSPSKFDISFNISTFKKDDLVFRLLNPPESKLFIGIWGGEMLHSYRFFAGSPIISPIQITSTVSSAAILSKQVISIDELQRMPLILQNFEYSDYHLIYFPCCLQSFGIEVNFNLVQNLIFTLPDIYFNEQSSIQITVKIEMYLDKNSPKYYFISMQNFTLSPHRYIPSPNILEIQAPLPGIWNLKIDMSLNTKQELNSILNNSIISLNPVYEQLNNLANNDTIFQDMEIIKTSEISHGSITLSSDVTSFKVNSKIKQIIFSVPLLNIKEYIPIGGSLSINLIVRTHGLLEIPSTISILLKNWNFTLAGRLGNIPCDYDSKSLYNNMFSLSNTHGSSVKIFSNSILKNKLRVDEIGFSWTISGISFHNLQSPEIERLFFLLDSLENLPKELQDIAKSLDFHLSASFSLCPDHTCNHGICLINKGEIISSSCYCKYPWAGESCSELSVSNEKYYLQVVSLVLSNFAMIPAIILAFSFQFYFVAMGLSVSSFGSAIYHLCDTDAYCAFGLSFQSLQVLDILFCTSMIAIILLLYAPITKDIHSTISIAVIGLLVSPITSNPTNAMNVILTISSSIFVVALIWLYRYYSISTSHKISYRGLSQIDDLDEDSFSDGLELPSLSPPSYVSNRPSKSNSSSNIFIRLPTLSLKNILLALFGSFVGLLGFAFFVNQSRVNYWYTHSLWHIFVMLSAYILILGRIVIFENK